jgi:hypothetical protein
MWWAGAVSVVVTAAVVGVSVGVADPAEPRAHLARPLSAHARADRSALAVLHRWDRRRAWAWARGDAASLARLYVAGSVTGRHDVHDLIRWTARGLRVAGLHQQVAAFRVVHRRPGRLVVLVTDRTIDGIAVGGAWRTAVPTSAWAAQRVTLRRSGDAWRVVEARAQPAR